MKLFLPSNYHYLICICILLSGGAEQLCLKNSFKQDKHLQQASNVARHPPYRSVGYNTQTHIQMNIYIYYLLHDIRIATFSCSSDVENRLETCVRSDFKYPQILTCILYNLSSTTVPTVTRSTLSSSCRRVSADQTLNNVTLTFRFIAVKRKLMSGNWLLLKRNVARSQFPHNVRRRNRPTKVKIKPIFRGRV